MDEVRYLSIEELLRIRDRLAEEHGDTFEILRFQQLLSALAAPQQSVFGEELFPTLCSKAAILLVGLIRNHPFWDGNKRIAIAATQAFLAANGYELRVSDALAAEYTRTIATGATAVEPVAEWLKAHSSPAPFS